MQRVVMLVQVPSTLNKVVHFKVICPVLKVLVVVLYRPVIIYTFLENEANEGLREVIYRLTGQA